jgi:hypothetical protein
VANILYDFIKSIQTTFLFLIDNGPSPTVLSCTQERNSPSKTMATTTKVDGAVPWSVPSIAFSFKSKGKSSASPNVTLELGCCAEDAADGNNNNVPGNNNTGADHDVNLVLAALEDGLLGSTATSITTQQQTKVPPVEPVVTTAGLQQAAASMIKGLSFGTTFARASKSLLLQSSTPVAGSQQREH